MVRLTELLNAPSFGAAVAARAAELGPLGLGKVVQVGAAVADVQTAAADLERQGWGPFFLLGGPVTSWTERGEPRLVRGQVALSHVAGIEVELLGNAEGTELYEPVPTDGSAAVHHLAFWVDEVDRAAKRLEEAGHPVVMRGFIQVGPLRLDFAYVDTLERTGLLTEVITARVGPVCRPLPPMLVRAAGWLQRRLGPRAWIL